MRSLLRIWPVLLVTALWCWLYFPGFLFLPRGKIVARDQEIRELREDLARAAVTTASLPETVKVYVEASEGQTRVVYRTQVENDTVEIVREMVREVPVEGETRVVILESGELEIKMKTRGWCFRPKAVLAFTTEKSALPGLGARFAFFGDGGLAGLALWDREDPEILPDYVGAEIDWRLRRLGMRNTAVGIGGVYQLRPERWAISAGVGLSL